MRSDMDSPISSPLVFTTIENHPLAILADDRANRGRCVHVDY